MSKVFFVNGEVYTPLEAIRPGTVLVENDRIVAVGPPERLKPPAGAEVIDVEGRVVLPGLIDLHFYGCGGIALTNEATVADDLRAIAGLLPRWGVTGFLISPMAADHETLLKHLRAIADAVDSRRDVYVEPAMIIAAIRIVDAGRVRCEPIPELNGMVIVGHRDLEA